MIARPAVTQPNSQIPGPPPLPRGAAAPEAAVNASPTLSLAALMDEAALSLPWLMSNTNLSKLLGVSNGSPRELNFADDLFPVEDYTTDLPAALGGFEPPLGSYPLSPEASRGEETPPARLAKIADPGNTGMPLLPVPPAARVHQPRASIPVVVTNRKRKLFGGSNSSGTDDDDAEDDDLKISGSEYDEGADEEAENEADRFEEAARLDSSPRARTSSPATFQPKIRLRGAAARDPALPLSPEEERLTAQLTQLLRDMENSTAHFMSLSPSERKRVRNRKASCISRIRKKLAELELQKRFDFQVAQRVAAEDKAAASERLLATVVAKLCEYEPGFSLSAPPPSHP
jgi:hypothetical protein